MEIEWSNYFEYDEECPSCLRWKVSRARQRKGDPAGSNHVKGYMRVRLLGKNYLAHRVVYELCTKEKLGDCQVDHIDGNTKNNKIANLRKVTPLLQARNLRKYKTNTSGFCGVRFAYVFETQYAQAYWSEGDERKFVQIKCKVLDDPEAFAEAKNLREEAIKRLTASGEGYTIRHGL